MVEVDRVGRRRAPARDVHAAGPATGSRRSSRRGRSRSARVANERLRHRGAGSCLTGACQGRGFVGTSRGVPRLGRAPASAAAAVAAACFRARLAAEPGPAGERTARVLGRLPPNDRRPRPRANARSIGTGNVAAVLATGHQRRRTRPRSRVHPRVLARARTRPTPACSSWPGCARTRSAAVRLERLDGTDGDGNRVAVRRQEVDTWEDRGRRPRTGGEVRPERPRLAPPPPVRRSRARNAGRAFPRPWLGSPARRYAVGGGESSPLVITADPAVHADPLPSSEAASTRRTSSTSMDNAAAMASGSCPRPRRCRMDRESACSARSARRRS